MAIPAFLREMLERQYGAEITDLIYEGFAAQRSTTLRVNTIRSSAQAVGEALTQAGIAFQAAPWSENALILPHGSEAQVEALPLYAQGHVYMQSLSSMVPPIVLEPQAEECILDMAAAPGGKTTQMAALSGNGALITACEKNRIRADRLQFNLDRQGASRVNVMCTDARQLNDLFRFDKVLLDAPCTGSGTILIEEGEPERRMTADWVAKTAKTQKAMLKKALMLLSAGHEMVYSTCSILREENEGVLADVLPGMKAEVVPIDPAMLGLTDEQLLPVSIPGVICVKPTALHEGFFVAKIRKRK